jgi:hypothetical protein
LAGGGQRHGRIDASGPSTPVNLNYDVPFKLTGNIHKVTIDLK